MSAPAPVQGAGLPRLRTGPTRLDRLPWGASGVFGAYGLRFGLRAGDAAAFASMLEWAPRVLRPSSATLVDKLYSFAAGDGRRRHRVFDGDVRVARGSDLDLTLDAFRAEIELFIAEHARNRVFVHAAVLGWKGRAVVVPGPSETGKTTLAVELIRRGAVYLSDEYAVFDARGRVHPFP